MYSIDYMSAWEHAAVFNILESSSLSANDIGCITQDWQSPALDALATWLTEDPGRIEPRLTLRDPVERFVKLFASYSGTGGSDALAGLLDPFLRILRRSPQITVRPA